MNTRRTLLAALVAVFALGPGFAAFAADPHQHAADEPTTLTYNHGKKWATDEPLRKNMGDIRTVLAAQKAGIHRGTLTSDDYKTLGTFVEARVATIVTECKLEPAADANLHLIVAELIAGADAMQGKSRTVPAKGAVQTVRAMNEYGRYFSHPGWKPLE